MGLKRLQILGSMGEDYVQIPCGLWRCDCCQIRTAVKPGLLSNLDCCQTRTAVKPGLLSNQDCCQTRTDVQTWLLSNLDCCPNMTDVQSWLLSNQDCCPIRTTVQTWLLSSHDGDHCQRFSRLHKSVNISSPAYECQQDSISDRPRIL
jgi:hypothetical protein